MIRPTAMRLTAALLAALIFTSPALAVDNPIQPSEAWEDIRPSLLGDAPDPAEDPAQLLLDAPPRADNPALVPVRITQPRGAAPIERLAVVIDGNPAPIAATFELGEALMPLDFELRVRVDAYTNLRAIAWLADGRVVQAGRFVKASGGCAAPAGRSAEEAAKVMGQMRLRSGVAEDGRAEATLMIRHPMNSGLQRDQFTLLDIPAMFIQTLEVSQAGTPLMTMEAGISISEDPVFRFAWQPGEGPVTVHAEDTDGNTWDETLPVE